MCAEENEAKRRAEEEALAQEIAAEEQRYQSELARLAADRDSWQQQLEQYARSVHSDAARFDFDSNSN